MTGYIFDPAHEADEVSLFSLAPKRTLISKGYMQAVVQKLRADVFGRLRRFSSSSALSLLSLKIRKKNMCVIPAPDPIAVPGVSQHFFSLRGFSDDNKKENKSKLIRHRHSD